MGQKTPATIGEDAYRTALKAAFAARKRDAPLFMTWGFSADTHGELSREVLDGISRDVPILVLQRSLHEAYVNTPMLAFMKSKGLDENRKGIRLRPTKRFVPIAQDVNNNSVQLMALRAAADAGRWPDGRVPGRKVLWAR